MFNCNHASSLSGNQTFFSQSEIAFKFVLQLISMSTNIEIYPEPA